jgi:hypothetical protein
MMGMSVSALTLLLFENVFRMIFLPNKGDGRNITVDGYTFPSAVAQFFFQADMAGVSLHT